KKFLLKFLKKKNCPLQKTKPPHRGGGAPPRHSILGFYVLGKTYFAIHATFCRNYSVKLTHLEI
ncbi:MAG: hypothetical protein ACK56L_02190, partial [Pseudanabaena sp.]